MKIIKNKKAQIPEAVIIIVALLIGTQAVYSSYVHESSNAKTASAPIDSLNFFFNLDRLDIFNRESGKLAISQSYADAVAKPANCKLIFSSDKPIAVWNETCGPMDDQLRQDFSKELVGKFTEISGKQKFKIIVGEKEVNFTPSDIKEKFPALTEVLKYEISHSLYSPFSLESPELNLEKVHSAVILKKTSCAVNKTPFEECMRGLDISGWRSSAESGEYLVFTLKSDKSYFYDNSFKPVEIKFALQKLS